jgi:alcohol-forming fatty acyl-CoA reductase
MELCKEMKNINAMVHISSAYVNSFLLETEEKLYPAPEDAEKVILLATTNDEETLERATPNLLKDHPNTYTFTKHLAEHEVNKCASKFPCGIVRPSMITAAWNEVRNSLSKQKLKVRFLLLFQNSQFPDGP